ncbi:EVE domain-containing protein [Pedococcus bigeumensis]|nr:EVE domain-containing protein [Pedococcus bigeumensis]
MSDLTWAVGGLSFTGGMPRCWVNTVSLDHVRGGVAGGFTQADHGARTRLARLRPGDRLVFYSPRQSYPDGAPLQAFTAHGVVTGLEPYRVEVSDTFHPWRLAIDFEPLAQAPIRPLLGELSFIKDPAKWGFAFRRGLFEIPADDFDTIVAAMRPFDSA